MSNVIAMTAKASQALHVQFVMAVTKLHSAGEGAEDTRLVFSELVHNIVVGQWVFVTPSLNGTQFLQNSSADS